MEKNSRLKNDASFNFLLREGIKNVYDTHGTDDDRKRYLTGFRERLREAGFDPSQIEQDIDGGLYGPLTRTLYYHALIRTGHRLNAEQEKFRNENINLIF